MKKKLSFTEKILSSFFIFFTSFSFTGYSQKGDAAFNKGDNTIGISAGVGANFGYSPSFVGNYINLPALTVYYYHGTFEKVGPGTIGIGGMIGWKASFYNYNYINNNLKSL